MKGVTPTIALDTTAATKALSSFLLPGVQKSLFSSTKLDFTNDPALMAGTKMIAANAKVAAFSQHGMN